MLAWALKEWDVAVTALLQGDTLLLLRKGGIREQQRQFTVAADQVLLLPTFEHQTATWLKSTYQSLLAEPSQEERGKTVSFPGWAEITHVVSVSSEALALALLPHLIWNQRFVEERLRWQPERPLYALLLRAYRFEAPLTQPWQASYGGCRSWVALGQPVAVEGRVPVIAEADYQHQVETILATVSKPQA